MKRAALIAAAILLTSGTAAMAASPGVVAKAVASCCDLMADCCGAGAKAPCCP